MAKKSTYFFIGNLSDQSAKYFVNEYPLIGGFFLEVHLNGIALWVSTKKDFDNIFRKTKEIFDIIIPAFVFKTNKTLTYRLEHWVEAKETISRKNIVGWILNPFVSREHYPRQSKKNSPWKKAAWFYNNLRKGNNNHTLALKDYHSALLDVGPDSFLFAYRAVEDICRAVTGCDEIGKNDWGKMRKTLRITKTFIDPLTNVSKLVRHGSVTKINVKRAIKNRGRYLNITHSIIEKEFKRKFPQF